MEDAARVSPSSSGGVANISAFWRRASNGPRRREDSVTMPASELNAVLSLSTGRASRGSPLFGAFLAIIATVVLTLMMNLITVSGNTSAVTVGSGFAAEGGGVLARKIVNPEDEADSDGIRVVQLRPAGFDDDAELPDAEDDDDGLLSMKARLQRMHKTQAAAVAAAAAVGQKLDAPAAPLRKHVDPAIAVECARRMSGTAFLDYDRVLLPPQPLAPAPGPALVASGGGFGKKKKAKRRGGLAPNRRLEDEPATAGAGVGGGVPGRRGARRLKGGVRGGDDYSPAELDEIAASGGSGVAAGGDGEGQGDANGEDDSSSTGGVGGAGASMAALPHGDDGEPAAQLAPGAAGGSAGGVPSSPAAIFPDGSEAQARSVATGGPVPHMGTAGTSAVPFHRPLTLLLDEEHLLLGDLFLAGDCVVFVTVKNKAQPDWLVLRRILLEVSLPGDADTGTNSSSGSGSVVLSAAPFSNVALSQADAREPVGIGRHCLKGPALALAASGVLPAVIRYRQHSWRVNIRRVTAPGKAGGHAMSTLVGHNWRLLPSWLSYWRKLGVSHFYLFFNDYLHRIVAEPDGAELLETLRPLVASGSATLFEWPFKFDVRVKVTKGGAETRLRLQHIAQPLRSHACFYRHRGFHKYMWFFDIDEYLLPHSSTGASTLSELIRAIHAEGGKGTPILSFSNRWAAAGPLERGDTGLIALPDVAGAGVFADREVVLGKRTKFVVACKSKVVFVHIHKATTASEYVKASTHQVSPKLASFLHFTNLDTCHGSVAVDDVLYEQSLLTSDPSRRDGRFHQFMADWRVLEKSGGAKKAKRRALPAPAAPGIAPAAAAPGGGDETRAAEAAWNALPPEALSGSEAADPPVGE